MYFQWCWWHWEIIQKDKLERILAGIGRLILGTPSQNSAGKVSSGNCFFLLFKQVISVGSLTDCSHLEHETLGTRHYVRHSWNWYNIIPEYLFRGPRLYKVWRLWRYYNWYNERVWNPSGTSLHSDLKISRRNRYKDSKVNTQTWTIVRNQTKQTADFFSPYTLWFWDLRYTYV